MGISTVKLQKSTLLIVGSFPKSIVYGGIYQSCRLIKNSSHFSDFRLILFDSSQISNPPPKIILRIFLSGFRLIHFVFKIIIEKPTTTLIFCSDGASALEKSIMIILCKSLGIKTLIFPRAGNLINQTKKSNFFKWLIRRLFNKANVFLAQGENWKVYANEVLKINSNKIKLVHNWTAKEEFLKVGKIKNYNIKNRIINFLFVGWLEKEKGVIEILKALKFLDSKGFKLKFTFIGDGTLMKFSKKFIEDNNLIGKVFLEGWKKPSEMKKYYRNSDVFVLPSWAEGMPNALIEALSCGLASIVTDVGMISNYLEDNYSAIILPTQNVFSLEKAMQELIINKPLREMISKNGHIVSKQYFSTDKGLESLAKTIKTLI